MIYTVTLNPSLDYRMTFDHLKLGELCRAKDTVLTFGGKGINVSVVLRRLGLESRALGFLGGFCGREIAARLEAEGCRGDFLWLEGQNSRINVKLLGAEETELGAPGPALDEQDLEALHQKLSSLLRAGDTLILSGSAPYGAPQDIYGEILRRLAGCGIAAVVDAGRDLLLPALPHHPLLIKPNLCELGEIFGAPPKDLTELLDDARRLQRRGAQNVLVSLGEHGALLLPWQGAPLYAAAPRGQVRGTTGAGDSMVAGFLAGLPQGARHALALGVAAGSATAFGEGLCKAAQAAALLERVEVRELAGE